MTTDAHVHSWHRPKGGYMVIDTHPAKRPYRCDCGAFTHDPETGAPCSVCAPDDYARRSLDLIHLLDGPFDGFTIVRPPDRSAWFKVDDQKVAKYVVWDNDPNAWHFGGYIWPRSLPPRRNADES